MGRPPKQPILHRIIRFSLFLSFTLLLASAPLMRGLFFKADFLPYQIASGVVFGLLALDVILSRDTGSFRGPLLWGAVALCVAYGISSLSAVSKPEGIAGFFRHAIYLGVFLAAAHLAGSGRGRQVLLVSIVVSATLVALVGITSATGLFVFPGAAQGGRIMSTLQYPNALAAYLMFSSILSLSIAVTVESRIARAAISVAAYVQTLVFLVSYSRGGWVVYPIAVAILVAGMPAIARGRTVFTLSAALAPVILTVKRFAEAIVSKTPIEGLRSLALGCAAALMFFILEWAFSIAFRDHLTPQIEMALRWAAGAFATFTFAAYVLFIVSLHSDGLQGIVPAAILKRLATISLDNPSLLGRAHFTKDAFAIFLSRPLFGGGAGAWNALYHQFQKTLYWTTEVHNHFAQVLVESGAVGFLSYASIWVAAIVGAAKRRFQRPSPEPEDEASWPEASIWGIMVACIALGAHSAMDFELSLPAVTMQLFAALGVLSSSLWRRPTVAPAGAGVRPKPVLAIVSGALVIVLALSTAIPAYAGTKASYFGGLGAIALVRNDFHNAIGLYREAQRRDKHSASYSIDIAQAMAAMFALGGRETLKEEALLELSKARALEPNNLVHRTKEMEICLALGESESAFLVGREVTQLLPLDVRSWEMYARFALVFAVARDGRGAPGTAGLLADIAGIPDHLGVIGDPKKLRPTPSLRKYVGQAHYLLGNYEEAAAYLSEAAKDSSLRAEASLWLEAVRIVSGGAPESLPITGELGAILSYSGYDKAP